MAEHARSANAVHEILVGPVSAAEQTLCCELQGHMQEKLLGFTVLSIQTLAEKVRQREECMNEAALAQSGFSPEKLKIQVGELGRQEWDMGNAKLDCDLKTLKVYKQRCSDAEALHYIAAREHSYRRHTAAVTAA